MTTFFATREIEGRKKWLELNLSDILNGKKTVHFTDDPFCPYDFDMTATTTLSYGEIKTVHRNYNKYPDFQIDYIKVKTLQDISIKDSRRSYVVGFFDDETIVWDVTDMNLEERKYNQFCTSTTANYSKGKKEKEEIWLKKEEAIYPRKTE